MAFIRTLEDWTVKPPVGTPLRADGHWSVQGLVGFWALNEATGMTAINALGVNHGALVGSPVWGGGGLVLDGSAQRISMPNSIPSTPNGTLVIRVAARNLGAINEGIWSNQLAVATNGASLQATSTATTWQIHNGSAQRALNALPALVANQPTTIAATWRAGIDIACYYDGVRKGLLSDATIAAPSSANIPYIGAYNDLSATRSLACTVEYAMAYSRALTAAEVALLSENPWQVFEPEVHWINVGSAVLTEDLTSLITSSASATDRQDYIEAATSLITSGASATDVQAMIEAVLSTVSESAEVTESVSGGAQTFSETLLSTAISAAQADAAQSYVDALTSIATTAASMSEVQLFLDNLTVIGLSAASAVELQAYLAQVTSTAIGTGSVVDILQGAFVGRYIIQDLARPRSFTDIARARSYTDICRPRGRA